MDSLMRMDEFMSRSRVCLLGFQATPFWITKRNGRSVSLSQAGRKVSFGYTQERLKYFTTSRSNCLESRLAKR